MSKMIVGVDGKPGTQDAIALAAGLAQLTGASLLLASAFPYDERLSRGLNREFEEYLRRDTEEMLDHVREAADLGPDVETRAIANPSASHALHDLAEDEGAGLIVVGSTHTGHLGRVLPGSTAERLLHGAPCPVAVAPRGYADRGGRELATIGCAYDGPRTSELALAAAQGLARVAGARLKVVRVFEPLAFGGPPVATTVDPAGYNETLRDRAQDEVDEVVERLDGGAQTEVEFFVGDPARLLIEASEGLDLLFVGSRGYGPLHAVLVGGVAGRLVRKAACPVVVFPRGLEHPERSAFADTTSMSS